MRKRGAARQPLSWWQRMSLEFGRSRYQVFRDEDERREAWFAHREEILERWRPGSRPAAWWAFESPEPRERPHGQPTSSDDPEEREFRQLNRLGVLSAEEVRAYQARKET